MLNSELPWRGWAAAKEPANSELSANGTPRFSVRPKHLVFLPAFLPDFATPLHVTPTKVIQREKYYTVPQPVTRNLAVLKQPLDSNFLARTKPYLRCLVPM